MICRKSGGEPSNMQVARHWVCFLCLLCLVSLFSVSNALAKTDVAMKLPSGKPPVEIPPWLQYQAGVAYMNGEGVSQDLMQGRYWIHMAARQGVPLAQYNLGVMFFDGIGGEQNSGCAQWWLQRAQAQHDEEVRSMAEQALSAMVSDTWPKVYRAPTMSDCNRLPSRYEMESRQLESDIPGSRTEPYVSETSSGQRILVSLIKWVSDVVLVIRENGLQERTKGMTALAFESDCEQKEAPGVKNFADEVATKALLPWSSGALPEEGEQLTETSSMEDVSFGPAEKGVVLKQEHLSSGVSETPPVLQTPLETTQPAIPSNLRTASDKHYTLQLASAPTPEGLYKSAKRYHLTGYLVYETVRHNQRWYVLVSGEYPTRDMAHRAIRYLPPEFQRNGAWVRSLRQVQKELFP